MDRLLSKERNMNKIIFQRCQLTAVELIRMIRAVQAPVTSPRAVDTLPISALKLVDLAA